LRTDDTTYMIQGSTKSRFAHKVSTTDEIASYVQQAFAEECDER